MIKIHHDFSIEIKFFKLPQEIKVAGGLFWSDWFFLPTVINNNFLSLWWIKKHIIFSYHLTRLGISFRYAVWSQLNIKPVTIVSSANLTVFTEVSLHLQSFVNKWITNCQISEFQDGSTFEFCVKESHRCSSNEW